MPWYKSGTVNVALNSNSVIGVGTAFIANCRVGDAFRGPDGGWYEVTNIASDTAMSISPNYKGATASGATYAIVPVQGYQKGLADQVRDWVNTYGSKMAALGTAAAATLSTSQTDTTPGRVARICDFGLGATGAGNVTVWPNASLNNAAGVGQGSYSTVGSLTDIPAGFSPSTIAFAIRTGDAVTTTECTQTLTNLQGLKATRGGTGNPSAPTWSAWVISAKSGANSDITAITGLTTALSIAQGGTGQKTASAACDALGALKRGVIQSTGGTQFQSGAQPNIGSISSTGNDRTGPLVLHNGTNSSASACISFIREGAFGCHLGIDTDNVFKVGGWSFGNVAYKIYHEGNTTRAADGTLKAV